MKSFKQFLSESVTFKDETLSSYSGQTDNRITAFDNDKAVGYIDYTEYGTDVSIKFIEVPTQYRHKGIGEMLALQLQKQYPKTEIDWGMLTTDGAKLYNKVKGKMYVDKARLKKISTLEKRLKKNKDTIAKMERDDPLKVDWDKYNSMEDENYDIEKELWDLKR